MLWRKKNIFGLEFIIQVFSAVTVCHFMPSNPGRWKPTRSCVDEESRYWPCRTGLWFSKWVEVRCLPWFHDLQLSFSCINGVFFWKFCLQQSLMGRFQDNCWQQILQCLDERYFYCVDLCVQLLTWTGGRWRACVLPWNWFQIWEKNSH